MPQRPIALVLLFAALLAGCAQELVHLRQMATGATSRIADRECRQIYSDERLEVLSGHFPRFGQKPTEEMLASERKPHPTVVPAIRVLSDSFLACAASHRKAIAAFNSRQHLDVYDAFVNRGSVLYERLSSGEISYGEYLRSWRSLATDLNVTLARIDVVLGHGHKQEAIRIATEYISLQKNLNYIDRRENARVCFETGKYLPCSSALPS